MENARLGELGESGYGEWRHSLLERSLAEISTNSSAVNSGFTNEVLGETANLLAIEHVDHA